MSKLNVAGAPISGWTVEQGLKELGLGSALSDGRIAVTRQGRVTVRTADAVRFDAPVRTSEDLEHMLQAVGSVASSSEAHVPTRQAMDIFGTVRDVGIENRVNARTWLGKVLTTEMRPEFSGGQRYAVPMVRVPAEDAKLVKANAGLPGMRELEAFLRQEDGSVLLPMHPQELEHRELAVTDVTLDVRNASSERTLHTQLPGVPNALVKLDLKHIVHAGVTRELDADAGDATVLKTEFLVRWVDMAEQPRPAFCFLPEPMAVADTRNDVSAVIRVADPYPPREDGQQTWLMPAYSLSAPDPDFPTEPPMLIRMLRARPDASVKPLDYALKAVVGPMIESALNVHLDLGSSAQAHGQNTFLEIGEDGQPTGRMAHSDLEAFWPHPDLARPLGRDDYFEKYGFAYKSDAYEADVSYTFDVYFVQENLGPIVDCLSKELGFFERRKVKAAVDELIRQGVQQRREVVLSNPALAGFKKYL
ncbi:MAG: hypothetical protein IPJ65_20805 [Archangiaceae bacterium]|nr:hypothetical protein [Archangiaceae bacterium]